MTQKDIEIVFYVSLIFFAISFAAKNIVHVYLDYKNGYKISFGGLRQLKSFQKYEETVCEGDIKLKALCNQMHKISTILFYVFIIVFLIKVVLIDYSDNGR
jgi:hypothetical protein